MCVEPLGSVVIMFASIQGIWCLCIGVMLVAEYIADPSATVSVVITFRMVTDVESASGDACVDVTSGSLSAYGFRIRREFNCVTVWGIGCRLLRCPLSRGKTGGYRGKVGAGRVNSRVWFTHSRSAVTALHEWRRGRFEVHVVSCSLMGNSRGVVVSGGADCQETLRRIR